MKYTREDIGKLVTESMREILEPEKRKHVDINETTNPIRDFALESVDGITFACVLSEKLEGVIPPEINPLIDDEKKKPRSIGGIIDLIENLLKAGEETANG